MLTIKQGDIFDSKAKCLVNPVNCVGVMGKGLALEFKNRYPGLWYRYKSACNHGYLKVGEPYILYGEPIILLFPTKNHWRERSRIEYIADGLDYLVMKMNSGWVTDIQSIAFPALGCGLGGLDWAEVSEVMVEKLKSLPIEIEIYEPN